MTDVSMNENKNENQNKNLNKKNVPTALKVVIIIGGVIIALRIILFLGVAGVLMASFTTSKPEVYEDVNRYREYMSFSTSDDETKWEKWGMDETIWPERISRNMDVKDFTMVYFNPWDAQYLGYMVVDYPKEEYEREVERLKAYSSTEYIGYYGVREETTYDLLAINADPYYGFVYALTDGKGRIIYAEQIFCNYSMDLDYRAYIPEEYLLDGFDASLDNEYELKMMGD